MQDRNKLVRCSCGAKMTRPIVCNAPFVDIWKPLFLQHATHEGKWFHSKQELRDFCKKEKVSSAALL